MGMNNCVLKGVMICTLHQIYCNQDEHIKEDGIAEAQYTKGRREMNMEGGQKTIDNKGPKHRREDSRMDIKETGQKSAD